MEIGKAWECGETLTLNEFIGYKSALTSIAVLLLDEADVFLEARTVPNRKHNAIVSGMTFPLLLKKKRVVKLILAQYF